MLTVFNFLCTETMFSLQRILGNCLLVWAKDLLGGQVVLLSLVGAIIFPGDELLHVQYICPWVLKFALVCVCVGGVSLKGLENLNTYYFIGFWQETYQVSSHDKQSADKGIFFLLFAVHKDTKLREEILSFSNGSGLVFQDSIKFRDTVLYKSFIIGKILRKGRHTKVFTVHFGYGKIHVLGRGVARAFPGGGEPKWDRKWDKFEEKQEKLIEIWGKNEEWNSCPPRTVRLAMALMLGCSKQVNVMTVTMIAIHTIYWNKWIKLQQHNLQT